MKQSKLAFEPFHSPAVGVMGSDDLDKRRQMRVAKFFVITCLIIISLPVDKTDYRQSPSWGPFGPLLASSS